MSKENQRLTGVDQKPAFLDGLSIKARDIFSNLKGFKDVDSKDIHIEGIDPKRYGSFDRTMNYVTGFFNKRRVAFAALLTLTSCTTGGAIGVSVMTSEPRETSTLPGDLTKTPESPTEATYELTPTAENPATQELTLVHETEVATEMPTITLTPEPTPTATEITEKYPIDLEKLHNFPESYEYMVKNLDEFVEAPDPLEDLGAFREWVGKLEITIGDYNNREVNYWSKGVGFYPDYFEASSYSSPNKLEGQPEVAYFKHGSEIFPMLGLNVYYKDGGFVRTMLVILYNGNGSPEGKGVIDTLADGGRIRAVWINSNQNEFTPPIVNEAIEKGILPAMDELNYNQIIFGIGGIQTEEGFQKMINGN
jgi:hypothetical protein